MVTNAFYRPNSTNPRQRVPLTHKTKCIESEYTLYVTILTWECTNTYICVLNSTLQTTKQICVYKQI